MYEEREFKLDIKWKSLLIKLGILLLIAFVVCFIIFRPGKNKNFVSLANNIKTVKEAAIDYFKNNYTFKNIGDYARITLEELENNELLISQKDSNGNDCDNHKSYAHITKVRDNEFILKISMNCGNNEESKVYNLTSKDLTIIAKDDNEDIKEPQDEEILVETEPEETPDKPNIKEETTNEDKELADNTINKDPIKEENKEESPKEEDKEVTTKPTCNSNKVLRYKHIKYGEWIEGNKTGINIENTTKEVTYYKYCKDGYCVIDKIDNLLNYEGYTASYSHKENIKVYRYIYVVWSNSCCVKGFINTGITECR